MRCLAFVALLMPLSLAGCTETLPEESWSVGGSFVPERTQADLEDFQARMAVYSDDVVIMESFPEQFRVGGLGGDRCDEVKELLGTLDYVASVGDCLLES